MAVATVTLRPGINTAFVTGKYVCDSSPSDTYINVGFVPSLVHIYAASDEDTGAWWSAEMANDTAMSEAGAAISSEGITPVAQTDGTNHGFMIGTNANIQEASKTFNFIAFR